MWIAMGFIIVSLIRFPVNTPLSRQVGAILQTSASSVPHLMVRYPPTGSG
jgi:hypothetical protein